MRRAGTDEAPWPELSLNDSKGDQPTHAKHVCHRHYFGEVGLPAVQPRDLIANSFNECCRLWDHAVETCETLLASREWQVRATGLALMQPLGSAVAARLIEAGYPAKQANEVKQLKPESTWPIHNYWRDLRADGKEIQWCVTFHPDYARPDGEGRPFLGLVAWPGSRTNEPLNALRAVSWRYKKCVVLVDASQVLENTLGGAEQGPLLNALAERIVEKYSLARPLVIASDTRQFGSRREEVQLDAESRTK